ncbi:MAG: tetratricopeptide repeat protein [Candidatus Puniceispirillum sp.]|jgi:tetratricopeptide (TPR) repeat protein|nr:tetratricopeptide repeat protein [Candidatus Puniceispirillum sp.]MBT6567241.1 tetratricopeptide repeat protein [Candidatus Puniceispirillum sp.]
MRITTNNQEQFFQTTMFRVFTAGALAILIACASTMTFAAGSDSGSSSTTGYSTQGANNSKELREAIKLINRNLFEAALVPLALETMQNPKNADAWNYTGFALRKSKRYDESMDAYNKALAIDPEHAGALEYQGELYLTLKQPDKAKANLAKLKQQCSFNCKERDDLMRAINAYNAAN